jgi:SAM-dependent methyltransferase
MTITMSNEALKHKSKAMLRPLLPVKFRQRLKAAYYFGFKHVCPFCHSKLRRFVPFGFEHAVLNQKRIVAGGCRPNSLCPVCGSLDRERLFYLYLVNKTNVFTEPARLLHVAPEPRAEKILREQAHLDYLTADLYAKDVMVKMDLCDIQFADNCFDAIICNHVLEHIVDDRKAMSELLRVLKPGGWAILQAPISLVLERTYEDFSITTTSGREQAFGQADHVRLYARDYKDRLENAGFKVEVFQWLNDAANFGGQRNKFGLNKKESLYKAVKPR